MAISKKAKANLARAAAEARDKKRKAQRDAKKVSKATTKKGKNP